MKFFVSDFHLGAHPKTEDFALLQFEKFCKSLPDDSELYILGDFFDFWIEYSSVIPSNFTQVYTILIDARKRGTKIFFIRGNHDFIRGDFFPKLGIEVFDDGISFEQNGKKFFCTHGDEIKGDFWYSAMRFTLRTSVFQFSTNFCTPI